MGVEADVRFPAEVAAACARATATLGPVEILVGAAGVYGPRVSFVDADPDEWWQVVETNVRGAALFARAVLPSMLEHRRGHIVNVGSRAAFWDDPGQSSVAYSTSKAALARFTGALAAEVAGTGVFVVDLGPGLVRTNMTATRPDRAELPDDAFVPAAVVADAVVALVSGRYPELHGRFVHATDDLDELVVRVGAVPERARSGWYRAAWAIASHRRPSRPGRRRPDDLRCPRRSGRARYAGRHPAPAALAAGRARGRPRCPARPSRCACSART